MRWLWVLLVEEEQEEGCWGRGRSSVLPSSLTSRLVWPALDPTIPEDRYESGGVRGVGYHYSADQRLYCMDVQVKVLL